MDVGFGWGRGWWDRTSSVQKVHHALVSGTYADEEEFRVVVRSFSRISCDFKLLI